MSALLALCRAYSEAYPSEAARLLEASAVPARVELLGELMPEVAAGVLREAEPRAAADALAALQPERSAAIVLQLAPHAAASMLLRLDSERRGRLLESIPDPRCAQLRSLIEHGPGCAGGRVDPRAMCVPEALSAADAVRWVLRDPESVLHYVYALGDQQRLTGVVSLRELMGAPGTAAIESFMTRHPERLRADDTLEHVVRHPAWQRVHALPVVDAGERFLGALRYSAFRRIETELRQASAAPDSSRSVSALAELYGLGARSLLQVASAALAERTESRDE